MDKEISLEKYIVELRRIEEHRTKGVEKEIRIIYKALLRDLQSFIGEYYSKYAEDDKLSYEVLQRKGKFARFLEEVEMKLVKISPKTKKIIYDIVNQTYKICYSGMEEAVQQASDSEELRELVKTLTPVSGDIVKRAVENPISGLTLMDTLEKNRKDIIYDIKRNIGVGLMNGDRYSTMSKRISQSLDGDYKKAVRIVRTECKRNHEGGELDFYLDLDRKLQESNTGKRVQKTWHTAKDERVRPGRGLNKPKRKKGANHEKLEGKTLLVDEKFKLERGQTLCPGNSGIASEDINCRCWLSYKIVDIANSPKSDIIKEVELSNDEEYAVNKYISAASYSLNEKMRKGYPLNEEEKLLVKDLTSALNKMPIYKGIVKRSVSADMMGKGKLEEFDKMHQVGSTVAYKAFTSASTDVYDSSFTYQFVIESKTGRDIRLYNGSELEVLYPPNKSFLITRREGNTIYMKEG